MGLNPETSKVEEEVTSGVQRDRDAAGVISSTNGLPIALAVKFQLNPEADSSTLTATAYERLEGHRGIQKEQSPLVSTGSGPRVEEVLADADQVAEPGPRNQHVRREREQGKGKEAVY